jgi:hypothetical protein
VSSAASAICCPVHGLGKSGSWLLGPCTAVLSDPAVP